MAMRMWRKDFSDKATWATVTEDELRKMDEHLWLYDELPTPNIDQMQSHSAAQQCFVTAKDIVKTLMSEGVSCKETGFLTAQVRVHVSDYMRLK
eukprot:140954-Karenia_brevis.AAC.1